jgi:outer membrane protein assembly factor BamB
MRSGIRLAAITGVALLAVGCGGDAVGELIDEPPTLAPLVEERALWDGAGADAVSTVLDAVLRGETALIIGDRKDAYRLAAVDAATGAPRWSIDEGDALPGDYGATLFRPTIVEPALLVAGQPDDPLVLVPYHRDNCSHPTGWCQRKDGEPYRSEQGVAALSGRDGSVRWTTPVIPYGRSEFSRMKLLGASEDLLLVGSAEFDDSLGSLRTIALSASNGHQLWQQPGIEAYFITGGTVIGHIPRNPDDVLGVGQGLSEGTVVALDATSGERRWDLSQRFADSDAALVAGELVVAQASREGDENALVLEATTGREVARLGAYSGSCRTDARSLIACNESAGVNSRLATFQLDERKVRVSRREIGFNDIRAVWRGRVFLDAWIASDHPSRHPVLDRSANVLAEPVPGPIITISDRYAIFRTGEDGEISVHAVKP